MTTLRKMKEEDLFYHPNDRLASGPEGGRERGKRRQRRRVDKGFGTYREYPFRRCLAANY